jgi:hypothetical protein
MARAGDELVSVDAIEVLGLSIAQVEALLLGPEGSQVLTHVKISIFVHVYIKQIDTQVKLEVRHKSTDYTALITCKYVSILTY